VAWGDFARAGHARYALGTAYGRLGDAAEMERVSRHGLELADRSGRWREEAGLRWNLATALRVGRIPASEAVLMCEELAERAGLVHPGVLCELAVLRAMATRFDEAHELVARGRLILVEQYHMRRPLLGAARLSAMVEALAGNAEQEERELRAALDLATEFHEPDELAEAAARLSRLLARQQRLDEADVFATLSRKSAPAEARGSQALWRAATARVLQGRGDQQQARALASEAVRIAPEQMLDLRAELQFNVAELATAGDDSATAARASKSALELCLRKGNDARATGWST